MSDINTPEKFLQFIAKTFATRNAISVFVNDTESHSTSWDSLSGEQLRDQTIELAQKMTIPGIAINSRVVIYAEVSSFWIKSYLAALCNGALVCPLDIKLLPDEMEKIFSHFEPTHLIVSPSLKKSALNLSCIKSHQTKLITFQELQDLFIGLVEDSAPRVQSHSTVIYTSGTSGDPKAVKIGFDAMMFDCQAAMSITDMDPRIKSAFSILPLNHIYGLSAGLFYALGYGLEYCTTQSLLPEHVREILKTKKIGMMMVVPLFLKMIRNGIYSKVRSASKLNRILFKLILLINQRLRSTFVVKLFFKEIVLSFGDDLQVVIAGGAPLDKKVENFFEAIGWNVFNGYGLTETGPIVAVNSYAFHKQGTVGKPLPGIEVKIFKNKPTDQAGEIWVRGPNLFKGYYKADQLTRESLNSEGWFKTGDLGILDKNGFLSIVGRSKSMIVLSSGKKVQPEEIEEVLTRLDFVKESCVVAVADRIIGEKILAIVQLVEDSVLHPPLDQVNQLLKLACSRLAPFKRPHEFIVRVEPFPLTNSQKVKRHLVQQEYEARIL